jgi:hypothetical protein
MSRTATIAVESKTDICASSSYCTFATTDKKGPPSVWTTAAFLQQFGKSAVLLHKGEAQIFPFDDELLAT